MDQGVLLRRERPAFETLRPRVAHSITVDVSPSTSLGTSGTRGAAAKVGTGNSVKIIDAHHHLWNLDDNYYPWLCDPPVDPRAKATAALRSNYLLEDFRADGASQNVVKSVHVQAEFDPSGSVQMLLPHPTVRSCVTPDGVQRARKDRFVSTNYPGPWLLAHSIELGEERERPSEFEIACTVVDVIEWEEHVLEDVPPGRSDGLSLGKVDVTVTGEQEVCWVATAFLARDDGKYPFYTPPWAASALEVTDASGVHLQATGGGSTGGSMAMMFVRPDRFNSPRMTARSGVVYPVRIVLRVPARHEEHAVVFRWKDLPLPPIDDGR